jgi:hypothetical protein
MAGAPPVHVTLASFAPGDWWIPLSPASADSLMALMGAYPTLYEGVRVAIVPLRLIDPGAYEGKVLKLPSPTGGVAGEAGRTSDKPEGGP